MFYDFKIAVILEATFFCKISWFSTKWWNLFVCRRMTECFTLFLTPIGGAQRGKSVLAIECSIQRIILSWILVGLHNVTNFVKNFCRSTWMLPAINSWKLQWDCFQKCNLFRLTGGNKFDLFGKHCAQNMPNELECSQATGGKKCNRHLALKA